MLGRMAIMYAIRGIGRNQPNAQPKQAPETPMPSPTARQRADMAAQYRALNGMGSPVPMATEPTEFKSHDKAKSTAIDIVCRLLKLALLAAVLTAFYFAGTAIVNRAHESDAEHGLVTYPHVPKPAPISMSAWQHGAGGYNETRITRDLDQIARDWTQASAGNLTTRDAGNLASDVNTATTTQDNVIPLPSKDTAAYRLTLTNLKLAASDLSNGDIQAARMALNEASMHAPSYTPSAWHATWNGG